MTSKAVQEAGAEVGGALGMVGVDFLAFFEYLSTT